MISEQNTLKIMFRTIIKRYFEISYLKNNLVYSRLFSNIVILETKTPYLFQEPENPEVHSKCKVAESRDCQSNESVTV